MQDNQRHAGRAVVVTGGASGIGLATAQRFAAEGARVYVLDRDAQRLAQLGQLAPGVEGGLLLDVSDHDGVQRAFSDLDRRLGAVDVVVANAGISVRKPFLEISGEQWRRVVDTNLNGVFYTVQEAARRMVRQERGGVVLVTASTNGQTAHPLYADYNATKAAVILLARTMARELAPKVRVNAVSPGYVLTPMQRLEYTDEMLERVNRAIPAGRHAQPEEVAAFFSFLASDEAAYITGQARPSAGG